MFQPSIDMLELYKWTMFDFLAIGMCTNHKARIHTVQFLCTTLTTSGHVACMTAVAIGFGDVASVSTKHALVRIVSIEHVWYLGLLDWALATRPEFTQFSFFAPP